MDFKKHFSPVTDPRVLGRTLHKLTDIIGLSLLATLSGCEGYDDIEDFGKEKIRWLKNYLELPNGIPSHDTIQRLFESIDPKEFTLCFSWWVQEVFGYEGETLLHIDGKSNRRSGDKYHGKKMLHAVNVFAGENHLSLAQYKVDEKSNEITAIEPLINTLDIAGKLTTADAMCCQKDIAEAIIKKGGHYALAVKGNQQELYDEIKTAFQATPTSSTHKTIEKDHGRIEERTCSVISDLRFVDEAKNWKALHCIIRITGKRTIGNDTTTEIRYYISSMEADAPFFLRSIRSHWGIENRLHWVLDMVFGEDYCRKRKDNAAENFNIIRKMAYNILRYYKGDKKSLRRRRLTAAWNTDYLDKILKF